MGGGHHDLGERMKIPDYRIYKIEDAEPLMRIRDMLAQQGLKDPWLRNHVWRYNVKEWGTPKERMKVLFFRGFKFGFAAFLVTIAVEAVMSKKKGSEGHH